MILEHAVFEETHNNLESSRKLCAQACALRPPILEAWLHHANFERRAGEQGRVRVVYERAVEALSGDALCYLVSNAARYARRVVHRAAWGCELIESAMRKEPRSEKLWDARISHELETLEADVKQINAAGSSELDIRLMPTTRNGAQSHDEAGETAYGLSKQSVQAAALQRLSALFERGLSSHSQLSEEAKQALWRRYVQTASDYYDSVERLRELRARHAEAQVPKRRRTGSAESACVLSSGATAPVTATVAAAAATVAGGYQHPYGSNAADYAYQHAAAYSYFQHQHQQAYQQYASYQATSGYEQMQPTAWQYP